MLRRWKTDAVKVASTEITGRQGAQAVGSVFLNEFGWLPREVLVSDEGVDFYVEVVAGGNATGRHLGVQAKSGPSWFSRPANAGWWFPFDDDHFQYWIHHDLPIIVVLFDTRTQIAYWQSVTPDTVVSTGEGWKLEVPSAQVLDGTSVAVLTALAAAPRVRGDAPLAAFHESLQLLPPEAVAPLARLHAQVPREDFEARRPVERLAALLAEQRFTPDAACALLLEHTPRWLSGRKKKDPRWRGPDEREVWCAIGGYANEYDLPARAADAFRNAAEAGAVPEGYWRASAGIFEMSAGQPQAEQTLTAARNLEGGLVLAEIGLAVLAHLGRTGPIPLPASLDPLNEDVWRDSPTARLFLGDQSAAQGDHDQALIHYETALSRSPGSSTAQLLVARTLLARLNTPHSPNRDHDLRRVARLAEAARADRRRWAGPSEVATEVLLQAQVLKPDIEGALSVALPAPHGEATTREATAARLTALGARIAYQSRQLSVADELAAASTDAAPTYAAELAAARADATEAPVAERQQLWSAALAAATTPEQRFVAVQHLTQLGVWPIPELEELRTAGVIAPGIYAVLAAKAGHVRGDSVAAARLLRPHLISNLSAVTALAEVLEDSGKAQEAATVLQAAANRFADVTLHLMALDVLRRSGEVDAAKLQALRLLARQDLSPGLRLRLRHSLVRQAFRGQDWTSAAEHAALGLDEILQADHRGTGVAPLARHDSLAQDLAWGRVGALYNLRLWTDAWAAWDRYQPIADDTKEALIWIHLVRREPWTEQHFRALLDLRTRFADDEQVSAAALDTLNLALAFADQPDAPQWGAPGTEALPSQTVTELLTLAAQAMQDYQARHPHGSLVTVTGQPDAGTLKSLYPGMPGQKDSFQQVCQAIRSGDAVLGLAASSIEGFYMQSLIQRAAGILPACSTDPTVITLERRAAAEALDGTVVLDPSVLAVTTLLPERWNVLRAHFAAVQLPDVCMDDLLRSEENVRRLLASSFTASLGTGASCVDTSTLTMAQKQHLATRMRAVSDAAAHTSMIPVTDLTAADAAFNGTDASPATSVTLRLNVEGPWAAPLELALTTGLPLWSDDVLLREIAREAGAAAFGSMALTEVLITQGLLPDTLTEDRERLLGEFVVDIPLEPDLAMRQGEADDWLPRSVAATLSRPAPWYRPDALTTWSAITQAVATHQPTQLELWVHQASLGASATGPAAYTTLARILASALISAGFTNGALTALLAASAAATRDSGLDPHPWATAARTELVNAITEAQTASVSSDDIDHVISQLIRGA